MSFLAYRWAFTQIKNLDEPTQKLVLLALAERANHQNECHPSADRTAADLNICVRSVRRSLKKLAEIGLISIRPRANDSSIFTLNLDQVGDKKSPTAGEISGAWVTKSHFRGDKKSLEGVTKSHPNQSLNQSFNQQPPAEAAEVVVVGEKIIWEKPLADEEKRACELALAGHPAAQKFADELSGAARARPVQNPAGWLRAVVKNSTRENFCFEHAEQVAAARASRAAQAVRESLALPPPPPMPLSPPARPQPKQLSEAGRAALAALGRHPKPPPPQVVVANTVAASPAPTATPSNTICEPAPAGLSS